MSKEFKWDDYHATELQGRFLGWMFGGALLSALGFLLPWFKAESDRSWDYGGWYLLTFERDRTFLAFIVVALYLLLFIVAFRGRFFRLQAVAAVAIVLLSTYIIFLTAADTSWPLGTVNLGLILIIPGHALMLVMALLGATLDVIRELI